ncbi:hypothetical protein [Mesobacillus selenatarsenatis]|uniref:Intracellular proteinase inhibitor BsuPI domain-containing protein n=1 Tax=Mesobacillus selenatarsenatis (strain DSM 18680 / JCM 14380 / FERM P-15431 / SF-1) TaxID=1321606 RepID=A0A0A8X2U0_MESS1|nr:hypothetical protein [Mesobacillus selenatarsenatis]GAM12406.1 hypothetical protein SAMD00020551_0539 [Mesobacillus selenatarsenatis SF-1]
MKNIVFIFIGIFLLLVGCYSNSSNEPVKEEKKTDQFSLVIEGDKKLYQEDENIQISAYLKYIGEKDIEFTSEPTITIVIRNYEGGNVIEEIDFNDIKTTMKKEEKFSQTLNGINLEEGKYDAFVQTSPFSVDSNQFSLSTAPINFEVKN